MRFTHRSFYCYSLFIALAFMTGCAESPVVKTPVGWYHDIEGGIVSQPRLPVPGNDTAYPYVGLTPKSGPNLPSPALRQEITNSLAADRNLSHWQDVADPLIIPKVEAPPQQVVNNQPPKTGEQASNTNQKPNNDQTSSATLDAAGQDPQPAPNNNGDGSQPKQPAPPPPPPPKKTTPPVKEVTGPVVMPELRAKIDDQNVVLPAIPVNPPAPSNFPGFRVPSNMNLPPPARPSGLSLETPVGELVKFPIDSDTPITKEDNIVRNFARQNGNRTIFVHGYGDATSLDPKIQANAISLALLRAKTVAKLLIDNNVPESAIVIRAHAIGHGVRLRTDQ